MPRKLGQHLLIRDSILERIAASACDDRAPRVIEIGAGRGALTRHLLPRASELHAIELDTSFAAYLRTRFASEQNLFVHEADVLAADLAQWGPAVIAGNLPYYITSPIIQKFLDLDQRFSKAVFLMQWEVAQRAVANAGGRDYGYLSVSVQLICDVELICKVPPEAFSPPPKVDSAVVRFVRKPDPPNFISSLLTFASRSFAQKRKTLRNNLRPFYGALVDDLPEAGLRAEQLDIPQFIDLYNRVVCADRKQ